MTIQTINQYTVEVREDSQDYRITIRKPRQPTKELFLVGFYRFNKNQYTLEMISRLLNEEGYFSGSEFRAAFIEQKSGYPLKGDV